MSKQAMLKPMYIALLVVASIIVLSAIGSLLKLLHDVAGFQAYWDAQNALPLHPEKQLYVSLGDSTAQALGATRPLKGYVGLVASELARRTTKEVQIYNLSKSGAKVRDAIDRQLPLLKQISTNQNTVITLAIGANDMRDYDEQTFTAEIDELYSQLPKQAIVADVAYFGSGRYRRFERDVVAANRVIASESQKYGLRLAHLHDVTVARDHLGVHSVDFLHPSNRGYRNWAQAFIDQLGQ